MRRIGGKKAENTCFATSAPQSEKFNNKMSAILREFLSLPSEPKLQEALQRLTHLQTTSKIN